MRSAQSWLDEYGESHRNPTNKQIHWVCVPLIFWSIVALLWAIPAPDAFRALPVPFNWAILVAILVMIWYLFLSPALAAGVAVFTLICLWISHAIAAYAPWPLWLVAVVVFVLAWIGQFVGHRIEGRKPSFFKDIQFLLVGPAWLLGFLYRRFGIAY